MVLYNIEWKNSARKELKELPKEFISKIITAVEGLAENPFPQGSRKITGSEHTYRIRINDYRVVYSVDSGKLTVLIIRVRHRKKIYKNLT